MLRNKVPKCIALVLAVLLLFPASMSGQTARVHAGSSTSLSEAMKQYDGPYPVYIYGKTPTEDIHEGDREFYDECVQEIMQEVGLEENQLLLSNTYTYHMYKRVGFSILVAAWMTKDEIDRAQKSDQGYELVYAGDRYCHFFRPFQSREYSTFHALLILEATVGIRDEGYLIATELDINRDDDISALDALFVLQETVGLIAIAYPYYIKSWSSPAFEGIPTDWELEYMQPHLFFCASDENGDGMVNAVDIWMKYDDLWV